MLVYFVLKNLILWTRSEISGATENLKSALSPPWCDPNIYISLRTIQKLAF
jgi:hypothetical protein